MHKINTATATANGEFTDGDSAGTIPATDLSADWFNTVQREICGAVTGSGQTLDANNDGQLFAAIARLGIKCVYVEGSTYSIPDSSKGATVIFYEAKNLTLSGNLYGNSLLIAVPIWSSSDPASYTISYQSESHTIYKGCGLFGFASNGSVDSLSLIGVNFPIGSRNNFTMNKIAAAVAEVSGRVTAGEVVTPTASITNMAATSAVVDKYIDNGVVALTPEQISDHSWQLKSNWIVGQVKRVYDSRDIAEHVLNVYCISNSSESSYNVKIYNCRSYREFLCIGTITIGGAQYAELILNGDRN